MTFHFAETSNIMLKTMPYLLIRAAVYAVLGVAMVIYIGLVVLMGKAFGNGGAVVFVIGLAVLYGLLRLAKQYVLYLVDAGHIAVITEIIHKGSLPEGVSQFRYGKELVMKMFKEVSALFVVDRLVDGIVRVVNQTVATVTDLLPLPGIDGLTKIANSLVNFSLTYVDETILSYNLSRGREDIWESAKRGVILYTQNWKPILTTAAGCTIANFLAFAVVFIILLVPFGSFAMMTHSETLKIFWLAVAIVLSYGIKMAFFKPFFQTSMILTFNEAIKGQVPNPQWEARLEAVSDKFRELKEKAAAAMSSGQAGQPGPLAAD